MDLINFGEFDQMDIASLATALTSLIAACAAALSIWNKSKREGDLLRIEDLEESREFLKKEIQTYKERIANYESQLAMLRESHSKEIQALKLSYENKIAILQGRVDELEARDAATVK